MSRRALIIFGVFAAVFAVLIPALLITGKGSESNSPEGVAASYKEGQELFADDCGSCHTLKAAGADGVVGPNLDRLLGTGNPEANAPRVANAVKTGLNGRMPKGILQGEDVELVSAFVAQYAGK